MISKKQRCMLIAVLLVGIIGISAMQPIGSTSSNKSCIVSVNVTNYDDDNLKVKVHADETTKTYDVKKCTSRQLGDFKVKKGGSVWIEWKDPDVGETYKKYIRNIFGDSCIIFEIEKRVSVKIGNAKVLFEGLPKNGVARLSFTDSTRVDVAYKCCWYAEQVIERSKKEGFKTVKTRNNMAKEILAHVLSDYYEESLKIPKNERHGNPVDIELYTNSWGVVALDKLEKWLREGGMKELNKRGFPLTLEQIEYFLHENVSPCPPW